MTNLNMETSSGKNPLDGSAELVGLPFLYSFVNSVPSPLMILDRSFRVVLVNESLTSLYPRVQKGETYMGMLPGEVMGCVHAQLDGYRCGETHFCRFCCLRNAVSRSLDGEKVTSDCSISRDDMGLVLRVRAVPFDFMDYRYSVVTLNDIGNEKRRRVLERLFFHDILNTAGVIYTTSNFLADAPAEYQPRLINIIKDCSQILIDEIEGQRELTAAENNELRVQPDKIDCCELIEELARIYRQHVSAKSKNIQVLECPKSLVITSDKSLVKRVLTNMIKNALEASKEGETVTVACNPHQEGVLFSVHNPAHMDEKVKEQVFMRKFSTKGEGRGVGTYSMQLLTTRYLGGKVFFESESGLGTTFYLQLPEDLKPDELNL